MEVNNEASAATSAEYSFRLNSVFDPNVTGVGHQPRGHDQWATLYRRYLVHGCKYKIDFYAATDSTTANAACNFLYGTVVGPEGQTADWATYEDIMEYPRTNLIKIRKGSRNTAVTPSAVTPFSSSGNATCKGYVSMLKLYKEFRGVQLASGAQNAIWPTDFSATVSATPTQEELLTLWAGSLYQDAGISLVTLPNLYATVQLVYYVEYYDPVFPSAS